MNEDDLEQTWASRDLPILRAALRRVDSSTDLPDVRDLERDTGLENDQVRISLQALQSADPPYIEFERGAVMAVTERARRELGTWPSPESLVEALAAALEVAADTETEPGREGERGASEPLRKASAVPRKTLQSPSFPLVSGATFLSLRACVSAQDLRPSSRATTARRSLRDALAELGVRNVNPADR